MSYPIVEQIAQLALAALEGISTDNGYQIDPSSVTRPTKLARKIDPEDKMIGLVMDSPARETDHDVLAGPVQGVGWRQPFYADFVVIPSETDTAPVDQRLMVGAADIVKALMADPQWGNLAIGSEIVDEILIQPPGEGYEAVRVQMDVVYRVAENDPYTKV